MLALYETTDCVLHGIGDAQTMAIPCVTRL